MKAQTATVLSFTPETFVSNEISIPRISKNLDDAIRQVRPIFLEWIKVDSAFEHNTIEVAKAVSRAWDVFRASEPSGTKAEFARYFDAKIPEGARARDVVSNATFNRIQYLLHKVIPAWDGQTPVLSAAERSKRRERELRHDWKVFAKEWESKKMTLQDIRDAVAKMLSVVLPDAVIERALPVD